MTNKILFHSKNLKIKREPLFIAFSTQKGGVGKVFGVEVGHDIAVELCKIIE